MDSGGLRTIAAIAALFFIPAASCTLQFAPNPGLVAPAPAYTCPEGCTCMTEGQAEVDFDGSYTKCSDTSCGTSGITKKYCYKAKIKFTVPSDTLKKLCPLGCECMTGYAAEREFGPGNYKQCSETSCGTGIEGEFSLPAYCFSELDIDECVDTDGGMNYTVKGSAPGCVDECSEFSQNPQVVLKECYAEVVDGNCKVTVDNHDCHSVCENGKCLPPTCSDWIQNQGEAGVDCGGPCTASCACGSGCKCSTVVEAEQEFGAGSYTSCSSQPCGHGWQGDLAVNKYCYKKIESYDCTDTDGGANVEVRGSAPGCVDECTSNRDLLECTVIQNIDTCSVKQSPYKCPGLCEDGACQPPSCDDGIQNQDEVSIDCSKKSIYSKCDNCCSNGIKDYNEEGVDCGGTDCIPCGYIRVKGRILYEDTETATGQFKPVRHATFLLRLCEDGGCSSPTHEAEWTTNSEGRFDFMVPKGSSQSTFILFGDSNDFFEPNHAVSIAKDTDGCNEYVWWTSGCRPLPAAGTLNFGDLKIGMSTDIDFNGHWKETTDGTCAADGEESGAVVGGSAYFNIADAILYARQYVDGKRDDDDSAGRADVQYPDSDWSNYNPTWDEITLFRGDKDGTWVDHGFEDGTIIHEYGHYLHNTISEGDSYIWGSDHNFCTYGNDEEFAFSEGFAEYFGTIVPYTYEALSSPDMALTPGMATGTAETPVCEDFGWEGEATVATILWDLADTQYFTGSKYEAFDTISGRETLIINILDDELDNVEDAGDICEFVEQGWNCRLDGSEKTAIEALLSHYGVDCETGCD